MGTVAVEASADTLFDMAEVAKHASSRDCWLVISGGVYDVTSYLAEHPGGEDVMLDMAGKDATNEFEDVGHSPDAVEQLRHLRVGSVLATTAASVAGGGGGTSAASAASAAAAAPTSLRLGAGGASAADADGAAAAGGRAPASAAAAGAAVAAAKAPSRAGDAARALAATAAVLALVTAVMAARRYVATLYWQRKA
ncbi:hypothetical protein BU14_0212s0019 [Porphyra umbilicalis]|uniref:Cytochrome b5 heme-binding domain-containing protein n=1 Tax=Porphyra umbilicalis TaxID=2786 RepID=A0A1X6P530_PORUM|nr:hypothetical protein BU14_0212s0019 [Porphyra umbilicalis]|eukprot:OSX75999.1 hypothetical protein BU14_0212s0019 [Porphyra umbilicalis]